MKDSKHVHIADLGKVRPTGHIRPKQWAGCNVLLKSSAVLIFLYKNLKLV